MKKIEFYLIAIIVMTPVLTLGAPAYAQDREMILKGRGLGAVSISIQTNKHVINDSLEKELRSYIKTRLQEAGVETFPSNDQGSGARLLLSFHIGYANNDRKFLGYGNKGQVDYLVFMELFYEQPVTLGSDPSITAVVPTWSSSMQRKTSKVDHRPFVSKKRELKKDVFEELVYLMDDFVRLHNSTGDR